MNIILMHKNGKMKKKYKKHDEHSVMDKKQQNTKQTNKNCTEIKCKRN